MKYGLIVHLKTRNIGDDIQCYAMEKFLPRVDYLIDREHLDSFYTETGEKVAAFLGGWYLHKPLNWPPSPFLKLLPISFHCANSTGQGIFILKDYGAEWLKKIEPIGCRDEGTAELLESYGISAYISGCFALTLKPFADVEPHGKIVLVDCQKEVIDFIKKKTKKKIVLASHRYAVDRLPPEVVAYAQEHDRKDIIPTSHEPAQADEPHKKVFYKGSWSYRRALMEGLLKFYQGASLVVTKRLHAALPCLAMGTPVLMINGQEGLFNYRCSTFTPYINHTTQENLLADISAADTAPDGFFLNDPYFKYETLENFSLDAPYVNCAAPEDLLAGNFSFDFDDPLPNPGGHEKFVKEIRAACKKFITACEKSDEPKVDLESWRDYNERALRLKKIMQTLLPKPFLPNFGLLENDV